MEVRLGTARAYASSILLPNGTLWILGGLGKTKMLKSTELVWMEESGSFMTKPGPDMTQEVFGHCAFLHPSGSKVVNTGGFDGTNRYMKYTEEFHLTENSWETRPWSDMKTGRFWSPLNSFTCVQICISYPTCHNNCILNLLILQEKWTTLVSLLMGMAM